jgi:EAL domain-containing protein (putative c-di-GMP-specific phosphodiesterase class I)
MRLLDSAIPIESSDHVLRARRTAACTRVCMGFIGVVVILVQPRLLPHPVLGLAGFALIAITAIVHLAAPGEAWLSVEESLSATAAVLIVGMGGQSVSALSILWLVALASGVLARGGRVHWLGRYVVLAALVLPIARYGSLSVEYAALCVATLGLLLTSGRLTRELNHLLMQARVQAESAETLLLAGDIAARMTDLGEPVRVHRPPPQPDATVGVSAQEAVGARGAITELIAGDGLSMAVQPIVDVRSGAVHAYEALARFDKPGMQGSPLHWFSVADRLGQRAALERACVREALELLSRRPFGTSVSVNLSAPVLLERETMTMLQQAGDRLPDELAGLIVEITEETLVHGEMQLISAIEPLRRRGARLAVDDMGAGYSGLRQITTVHPSYLKLDRSLVSGIDGDSDGERAALVGALAGYSRQVGSLLVAEGVETEAELLILQRLGVPLIQGFYLGRPGPPWPVVSNADALVAGASASASAEPSGAVAVLAPSY